jgi:hypothetical protein
MVRLQAGSTVQIATTSGVCPGHGTFSIMLVAPSGRPVGRTHGDGCGSTSVTRLLESGPYELRVFDSGGFTGPYELQGDQQDGPPEPAAEPRLRVACCPAGSSHSTPSLSWEAGPWRPVR